MTVGALACESFQMQVAAVTRADNPVEFVVLNLITLMHYLAQFSFERLSHPCM